MNMIAKIIKPKTMHKVRTFGIKTLLSGMVASILIGLPTTAVYAKTDIKNLNNELEIMTSIMRSALSQGDQESAYKVRGLDVTYLSGQGVVFEVNTHSSGRQVFFEMGGGHNMVAPPIPPVPEVTGDSNDFVFEFESDDWQRVMEDAVEHAHEAMEQARDQMRDLRHKERDFAWQHRDAQRKLRDIEFEMRNADKERSAQLQKQQKQLEKEISELESQQREVDKEAHKLAEQQKQKAAQKREAKLQQQTAFISQFERNVSTTLCKYGNGLAALAKEEHVSFVLVNFATGERSNKQDKIYVFQNKDIQSCVKDKLSAEQLLAKADSYSF